MLSDYRKTLAEILSGIGLRTNDPFFERWTAAAAAQAINEVVLEFALATRAIVRMFPLRLEAGVPIYDLFEANRTWSGKERDYGYPVRIEYVKTSQVVLSAQHPTRNFALQPMNFSAADFRNYDLLSAGEPMKCSRHMVNPNELFVWPTPKETGTEFTTGYQKDVLVWFVALPNAVGAGGIDSLISPIFDLAITPGASARLLYEGDADDVALAVEYDAEFEARKQEAVALMSRDTGDYDTARPM
ncbi:MAG: hypothetical protein AAGU11_09965 [Syntrophobacteraceae bacterium]